MCIVCLLGNKLAGVFNFERFVEIYFSKYWVSVHLVRESHPKCLSGTFLFIGLFVFFQLIQTCSTIPGFRSCIKIFPSQQGDQRTVIVKELCCYLYSVSLIFNSVLLFLTSLFIRNLLHLIIGCSRRQEISYHQMGNITTIIEGVQTLGIDLDSTVGKELRVPFSQ